MVIQNEMLEMLTYAVMLLHDNARRHTAARTPVLLEHFNWELFDHPPYSPDLAPSDYHLFTYLKICLGSQRSNNNGEMMEDVETWLSSQEADSFEISIQKLISQYDKTLSSGGYYIEKYIFFVYTNFFSLLLLLIANRRFLSKYPSYYFLNYVIKLCTR
jgi:hypothetical protein